MEDRAGPHPLPLSSKRNFHSPLLVGEGRVRWERGARQGGVRAGFEDFKIRFDFSLASPRISIAPVFRPTPYVILGELSKFAHSGFRVFLVLEIRLNGGLTRKE